MLNAPIFCPFCGLGTRLQVQQCHVHVAALDPGSCARSIGSGSGCTRSRSGESCHKTSTVRMRWIQIRDVRLVGSGSRSTRSVAPCSTSITVYVRDQGGAEGSCITNIRSIFRNDVIPTNFPISTNRLFAGRSTSRLHSRPRRISGFRVILLPILTKNCQILLNTDFKNVLAKVQIQTFLLQSMAQANMILLIARS